MTRLFATFLLIFLIFQAIAVSYVSSTLSASKLAAMEKMKMDDKQVDKFQQLHYGWYMQSVSSLLGSVGKQMYMKMKKPERRAFVACLDAIEKEYDVKAGARCLVKAFDGKLEKAFASASIDPKLDFIETQDMVPMGKLDIKKIEKKKVEKKVLQKIAKTRARKVLTQIQKEKLRAARYRKLMRRKYAGRHGMSDDMKSRFAKYDKLGYRRRMKRNILSIYPNKEEAERAKKLDDKEEGKTRPINVDRLPELMSTKKSPVQVFSEMIRKMTQTEDKISTDSSIKNLKRLQDTVFGARKKGQYKNRMLDMVIGENHPLRRAKSFTDRLRDITPDAMVDENVMDLVDTVHKHTKASNTNFLSPRFFPVMPEKFSSKKNIFSPDLFPLYKDDSTDSNSVLPLPTMLEKAGLSEKDRNTVLELVMDVSGVNNVVDDALSLVKGLKTAGLDKDVFDMSTMLDNAYSVLSGSMNKKQNLDFVNKKFTFMNQQQMEQIYGENGIYNTSVTGMPFDFNEVGAMDHHQREEALKMTIRDLADGKGAQGHTDPSRRVKRQTITILNGAYRIVFLNPTVFSPMAFAPTINQLSVLGPLVLSPQLFCPSVLSPLLMSPPVISPQVGNPLIFSPYVIGPNVLSAAVFNAYVFSPYVLSPNVINPYVLSPLILSPFVLCPDVLSPTVLSGVVLSPSVLSPSIFTDSALAANVLSPTFLS